MPKVYKIMVIHINFSPLILFTINFYREINFTNYKIPCVIKIKISEHFKLLNGVLLTIYWYIMILLLFIYIVIENVHKKIKKEILFE